jgi:Intracellular proteinase inhibitor
MTDAGARGPDVPVPMPADGFRRAFAQGRERRRRRIALGGSAGALSLSAVVLGLTTITSSGPSLLMQAEQPTATPTTTTTPTSAPSTEPGPSASAEPGAGGSESPAPTSAATSQPDPAGTPMPGDPETSTPESVPAPTRPSSQPVRRDYDSPVPRSNVNGAEGPGYTMCGLDSAERPSNSQARWCGSAEVLATGGGSGSAVDLKHRICRASDGDQPALHFESSQEVEYEVWRGGALLWRWSDGAAVTPDAHELPAEPGACYDWRTRFATGDLAAGEYLLRTWVTAAELGPEATYEATFTVGPPNNTVEDGGRQD